MSRFFPVSFTDAARQVLGAIVAPGQYCREQNERDDDRGQDNDLTNPASAASAMAVKKDDKSAAAASETTKARWPQPSNGPAPGSITQLLSAAPHHASLVSHSLQ
jgi:hypothetical protein